MTILSGVIVAILSLLGTSLLSRLWQRFRAIRSTPGRVLLQGLLAVTGWLLLLVATASIQYLYSVISHKVEAAYRGNWAYGGQHHVATNAAVLAALLAPAALEFVLFRIVLVRSFSLLRHRLGWRRNSVMALSIATLAVHKSLAWIAAMRLGLPSALFFPALEALDKSIANPFIYAAACTWAVREIQRRV